MNDWRKQAEICEHCCAQLAPNKGPLFEFFIQILFVVTELAKHLIIGAGTIFFVLSMFVAWLFPHIAGNNSRESEEEQWEKRKEADRVLGHESKALAAINQIGGLHDGYSAHFQLLDGTLYAEHAALLSEVRSGVVDAGKVESKLASLSNELIDRRKVSQFQEEETSAIEESISDYEDEIRYLEGEREKARRANNRVWEDAITHQIEGVNYQLYLLRNQIKKIASHYRL